MLATILLLSSCASISHNGGRSEKGLASYYANKFNGRKTASGERYSHSKLTAAHRTLPFGTIVKVENLKNGKTVKVRINDRGPFVSGRVIDLSKKAARKINMIQEGIVPVRLKY
ncbi:septal ring lytic transglycosylase RlpA family protein [Echinicola salinicaeni]|uniref:septal ring lytic transglycosylase RlpA family protein n=1 Tax=Echinicola salinicaeni TaxID=2762757 RepID=UPI001E2A7667|nr:septal ring lytic transglycosylase RlpA family protein [Echinicola salinicaeni]